MARSTKESGNPSIQLVAVDPAMKRVLAEADRLAGFDSATVLIEGETGTGKELIARHIHDHSSRRERPFVVLDCATIPSTLMQSALFGYEKGAFTGAIAAYEGLLDRAEGGTLLIDELASLDHQAQALLLRFIETKEIYRVGNGQLKRLDVRIIAASNRNLNTMISNGLLRLDFYHRLSTANLHIPPLRERPLDIDALFLFYVDYWSTRHDLQIPTLTEEAWKLLHEYPWPGNVREIRNTTERLLIQDGSSEVDDASMLAALCSPDYIRMHTIAIRHGGFISQPRFLQRLLLAWRETQGHVTKTAELLGVSKASVSRYVRKIGLESSRDHNI